MKVIKINKLNCDKHNFEIEGECKFINALKKIKTKTGNELEIFNFFLEDSTDSIKVTAFGDKAKEFEKLIAVGKFFSLSNGTVQRVNESYKKYNFAWSRFEIVAKFNTKCVEKKEVFKDYKQSKFESIEQIFKSNSNGFINLLGIVVAIDENEVYSNLKNKQLRYKEIMIEDHCGQIKLIAWEENIQKIQKVQLFQSVKIENLLINRQKQNGTILTLTTFSTIKFDLVELESLKKLKKEKYQKENRIANFYPLSIKDFITDYRDYLKSLASLIALSSTKNKVIGEIYEINN